MVFTNAKARKGSKSLTINLLECISPSQQRIDLSFMIIHFCVRSNTSGLLNKIQFPQPFLEFNFREHFCWRNEVFISNVHLFSLWSDKWKVEMTKNALFSSLFECRTVLFFYICQIKFLNILCQQSHLFVRKGGGR